MPATADGCQPVILNDPTGTYTPSYAGKPITWVPNDYEQITVANAQKAFTPLKLTNLYAAAKAAGASPNLVQAYCRLTTAEISYMVDPNVDVNIVSTTLGTFLEINDTLVVTGVTALNFFRAIRTTGTSGVLNVTYQYGIVNI